MDREGEPVENSQIRQATGVEDVTLDELPEILQTNAVDGIVYANIISSHGRLHGKSRPKRLPSNVKLFVIASRGYEHLGGHESKDYSNHLSISLDYLKQLREGIEKGGPFHDEEGCLTELGEEILANMIITMKFGKHNETEVPKTPSEKLRFFAAKKYRFRDGSEWEVPFLSLKIYDNKFNDQFFQIDDTLKTRFGILFQYRDTTGEIKNVFLNLIYTLSESLDLRKTHVSLHYVFEKIKPLFDLGLIFNFTHMSCRSDYEDEDGGVSLTRELSNNGSESSSIHCFIKKHFEHLGEEDQSELREMLGRNFNTIYEFFNKLKGKSAAVALTSARMPVAAASQWVEYKDQNGRPYYYNTATKVSVWEKPVERKKSKYDELLDILYERYITKDAAAATAASGVPEPEPEPEPEGEVAEDKLLKFIKEEVNKLEGVYGSFRVITDEAEGGGKKKKIKSKKRRKTKRIKRRKIRKTKRGKINKTKKSK